MLVEVTNVTEEVKWYKNGEEIVPDPAQRYQVESMGRQHKLVIRSASLDDMGLYSCAVEERECSAQLHVSGEIYFRVYKIIKACYASLFPN